MQLTTNEVIEAIHNLPAAEQEKIRRTLESEKKAHDASVQEEIDLFKKSEMWIKENREEFLGQWVCLLGDELIAHGEDATEVHKQAKQKGIESPYVVRVIPELKNFTGTWL